MHLTLHFEPEADARIETQLHGALSYPFPVRPFSLRFEGLGTFPERGSPRVLWLGVGDGLEALLAVHRELHARLKSGPGRAEPFHPHLTLARFRDRVSRGAIDEICAFPAAAGPSPIERVTLYESRLSPKGPTYAAVADARLQSET
jgi:2'-5' RNA ligase